MASSRKLQFSDFFEIDPQVLKEYGAFNISLLNDLPIFIDPFLLFYSKKAEYRAQHDRMIDYLRLLRDLSVSGKVNLTLLKTLYRFPEVPQNWMGFCVDGNRGCGPGAKFAARLDENLRTVFRDFGSENITQSSHIEKLTLIEDRVGRDFISDFSTNLIKPYLLQYTQEFARRHLRDDQRAVVRVRRAEFDRDAVAWIDRQYELPVIADEYVILTPIDMLTRQDAWINRRDMTDDFTGLVESLSDASLRAQINRHLFESIPEEATETDRRKAQQAAFRQFPALIDYYIRYKEERGDSARMRTRRLLNEAETMFLSNISKLNALLDAAGFYRHDVRTADGVRQRLLILKKVVEEKGGNIAFLAEGKPLSRLSDLRVIRRLIWLSATGQPGNQRIDGVVDFRFGRRADLQQVVSGAVTNRVALAFFIYNDDERSAVEEAIRKAPAETTLVMIDASVET